LATNGYFAYCTVSAHAIVITKDIKHVLKHVVEKSFLSILATG